MDVVIPHIKGNWDSIDLRYTLRSIAKFYPEGQVTVIGHKPGWYTGAHVPFDDPHIEKPFLNTMAKLYAWAEQHPGDFLWLDDDTLMLEPYTPKVYHRAYEKIFGPGEYSRAWEKTKTVLWRAGVTKMLDYDIHCPMPYIGAEVMEIRTEDPVMFRSLYGNTFLKDSLPLDGEKQNTWDGEPSGKFLSVGDLYFGTAPARYWVENTFPEPSPLES